MSDAHRKAVAVEKRGMEDLAVFFDSVSLSGRWVRTDKGRLSYELQKSVGDILLNNNRNGGIIAVEVKIEEEDQNGNFFLETWSNLSRFTVGWMFTLNTDCIAYYFINSAELYVVSFRKLRVWAFQEKQIYQYPEKKQRKYSQMNDTWGRCVPITIIGDNVGGKKHRYLRQEQQWIKEEWPLLPSQTKTGVESIAPQISTQDLLF